MVGCGGGDDTGGAMTTPQGAQATAPATPATATMAEEPTATAPEEAKPNSTERPDSDGDGTPDIQTFRGKLGDTFTLVGQPSYKKASKEAVEVTVLKVVGPFSGFDVRPGNEIIGITVRLRGVGSKRFDDPQPGGQLIVSGGETGEQTSLITGSGENPCDNPSLKLKKGQSATVCIAYEIPKKSKPRVFEFATSSGYGDKGIWKLR